jgi:ADP-heptose:LPS heptosyltransferase
MRPPARLLLIGPSNIGDAILASDVLAALRQRYPEGHLTLVVGTRAQALFAGDPRIQTLVDMGRYDGGLGRMKLAWELWRYQPQVVVDLRQTAYPLLLKPLAAWRYLLRPPRTLRHMRARHLWTLRMHAPATASTSAADGLWPGPKDAAQIDALWRRWKLDERQPVVVICPGARSHIKRWTVEGFARVADRLIGEAQAQVVFSGEPEEEPIIQEILSRMQQRAHSAVGLTTIRQVARLMQRARVVITNDSASLHLASAMRTPTVALFGPTDALKYGPSAPRSRVLQRRLFCAPCEQALCRFNHECMRFVAPDDVYEAAAALLAPQP